MVVAMIVVVVMVTMDKVGMGNCYQWHHHHCLCSFGEKFLWRCVAAYGVPLYQTKQWGKLVLIFGVMNALAKTRNRTRTRNRNAT
jgi:hypothetical protein